MRVNLVPESARHLRMTRTRQMRVICVRARVFYLRPKYEILLKLISINQIIQNNQINQINLVTLAHNQTVIWVNMMIVRVYQFYEIHLLSE